MYHSFVIMHCGVTTIDHFINKMMHYSKAIIDHGFAMMHPSIGGIGHSSGSRHVTYGESVNGNDALC